MREVEEICQRGLNAAQSEINSRLLAWLIQAHELNIYEMELQFPDTCDHSGEVVDVTDDEGVPVESYATTAAELLDRYTGQWDAYG